jgi:hypothetical protein
MVSFRIPIQRRGRRRRRRRLRGRRVCERLGWSGGKVCRIRIPLILSGRHWTPLPRMEGGRKKEDSITYIVARTPLLRV